MLDAWDRFELDVEEAVDCGPDRLVTVILARGKGAGSGIEIEARAAMLWVVRSGKIRKGELFQTRDEALSEAATQA